MRTTIIAGNWKMNTDATTSRQLADAVVRGMENLSLRDHLEVVLCPPSVFVPIVGERIAESAVALGAQNVSNESNGAFTGEVSVEKLRSLGCSYVIVGHSE